MRSHLLRRNAVTALAALVLLGGCGKSISITDSDDEKAQAPAAATTPAAGNTGLEVVDQSAQDSGVTGDGGTVLGDAPQPEPPAWAQLTAVLADPLKSPRLVDVNQSSLYRFDQDSANPSVSTCSGDCAAKWPPVTVAEGGKVYLEGVDAQSVGAVRRDDGSVQLTVGGWPVYRFAQDAQPGELKGQGVGGTWFAVSPEGEKVQ